MSPDEAHVVINGVTLNSAQSMTLRVALESFASDMAADDALGDDEHGRTMVVLYRARIAEIRKALYPAGELQPGVAVRIDKGRP